MADQEEIKELINEVREIRDRIKKVQNKIDLAQNKLTLPDNERDLNKEAKGWIALELEIEATKIRFDCFVKSSSVHFEHLKSTALAKAGL